MKKVMDPDPAAKKSMDPTGSSSLNNFHWIPFLHHVFVLDVGVEGIVLHRAEPKQSIAVVNVNSKRKLNA